MIKATADRLRKPVPSPKTCIVCGTVFSIEDVYGKSRAAQTTKKLMFKERQTCSRTCAYVINGRTRRVNDGEKSCVICGAMFSRRVTEKAIGFRSRKTCSKPCGRKLQSQSLLQGRSRERDYPREFEQKGFRESIRERDGFECRLCGAAGTKARLSVHHIDYNKANLAGDNLITLCSSCHAKTNHRRNTWPPLLQPLVPSQ